MNNLAGFGPPARGSSSPFVGGMAQLRSSWVDHSRWYAIGVAGLVLLAGLPALVNRAAPVGPPALPHLGIIQTVSNDDVGDPSIAVIPGAVTNSALGDGGRALRGPPSVYVPSVYVPSVYVMVWTTDWRSHVPTAVSTDLVHWTRVADALPVLPVWATPTISMTWAPTITRSDSGWVMYFSTEERASGLECIGAATASSPGGPYVDRSSVPLLCQRNLGGSIDPAVIVDGHGATSLLWKNDGNSRRLTDSLWEQRLAPGGLQLTGDVHRLLSADLAWEQGVIEAPAMTPAPGGGEWLFYSGGYWSSGSYATGLAWCQTVAGPCQKTAKTPFLASSNDILSPGGLDTFNDAGGRLWVAFTSSVSEESRRHPGHHYYNRVLNIAPLLIR